MPTDDGQLFCDEFIGEVIGIDLLRDFRIHLPDPDSRLPGARGGWQKDPIPVRATAKFGRGPERDWAVFEGKGKTMGFALAELRERIREHYGR